MDLNLIKLHRFVSIGDFLDKYSNLLRALLWVVVSIFIGLMGYLYFNNVNPFNMNIVYLQKQSILVAGMLILLPFSAMLDISMERSKSSVSGFAIALLILCFSLVLFVSDKDIFGQLTNNTLRMALIVMYITSLAYLKAQSFLKYEQRLLENTYEP